MTIEQVQALKVGDLVRYYDSLSEMETLEIVLSEWGKQKYKEIHMPNVTLQTVAVINEGDDDDGESGATIGDEGWINEYNHDCFEKIA
jgi:hypothetical protein